VWVCGWGIRERVCAYVCVCVRGGGEGGYACEGVGVHVSK